jgi:hypothetical protein
LRKPDGQDPQPGGSPPPSTDPRWATTQRTRHLDRRPQNRSRPRAPSEPLPRPYWALAMLPPGAAGVRPWLGQASPPAVAIAPQTARVSRRKGAGWPRGPGRGSGRFWVGVVCLLPARALRVKGRGVWMDNGVVSWPWRRVAAQSQRFLCAAAASARGNSPVSTSVHGLARASQAEAAANAFGTSAAHPCPNQADPLWT